MKIEYVGLGLPKPSDPAFVPPEEFLSWANTDLKGSDRRNAGNALGNIKRALHGQIDEIVGRTRVAHCYDWKKRNTPAEDKFAVLTALGVQHASVLALITESRNDLEHTYILPSMQEVKAYVDVSAMWLEKVERDYAFPAVGFIGLPLVGTATGTPDRSGNTIKSYEFDPKALCPVKYFDLEDLVEIDISGTETHTPFKTYKWRDLLRLEVQPQSDCSRVFNRNTLAMLRLLYRRWLSHPTSGMVKIR